jgi:hypothetical protein
MDNMGEEEKIITAFQGSVCLLYLNCRTPQTPTLQYARKLKLKFTGHSQNIKN